MNIHVYDRRRAELERMIEEMISLLDLLDGDPDLEEGGDLEPSLAGTPMTSSDGRQEHDLEADDSDSEPEEDEPSLGWTRAP